MAVSLGDKLTFPTSKRSAKNRFLKAALSERQAVWEGPKNPRNGIVTPALVNLYSKWGHGGWGMILTGNLVVDALHMESAGNTAAEKALESDERREMLQKLAVAAKADGALVLVQLGHAGRQTPIGVNPTPFSASDVRLVGGPSGPVYGQPVGLSHEQIKTEVVDKFAYAAKLCASVGFDGVQIHAAHGYLLSQFLSSTTNKRTDKYGGSVENRARIVLEVYEETRKAVPSDFVIGIKMNSVEFQKDGLSPEEAATMAEMFEKAGFDFIELSGGTAEKRAFHHMRESTIAREAFFVEFAETIMKRLQKSVVYLTGGFRTANGMLDAIRAHATHGIGIGRPTTQEYDLASKLLEGKSSAAQNCLISMDDYATGRPACNTQMEQASRAFFDGDPNKGVMDLGNQETVTRFRAAFKKYHEECAARAAKGDIQREVLVMD